MQSGRVFRAVGHSGNWRHTAVVEHHDDHAIAIGFAETANVIVEHWLNHGANDLLFEPLVFNHRHALELILKVAIREAAARLRAAGDGDVKLTRSALDEWLANEARHNLHRLSNRLDSLLTRLATEVLPSETHSLLLSIHELDPTGEAFRYAKVKAPNGGFVDAPRPLLLKPSHLQVHVDIVAMHEHFRSAFSLISAGIMTALSDIGDYQDDMAQDADW
jgi:hypothetical protein